MLFLLTFLTLVDQMSFKEQQLKNTRVEVAYRDKEDHVKKYFTDRRLQYEGFHLFIRGFKKEEILEVWVKAPDSEAYSLLTTYAFCSSSGTLGPKRKEGDLQIPEGIYHVNHFNPESTFYLSLGVSYPNASDLVLSHKKTPGSAIYIHGNCVTVGCIPITDDKIKELYILGVEARNNGQQKIPIHIFPSHLDDRNFRSLLTDHGSQHKAFWENLKPVYADFEKTHRVKPISVDKEGMYHLK